MISVKDQLRKSLLEVCTPEDLREWFDPLAFRFETAPAPALETGDEQESSHAGGTLVVTLPHALFAEWFSKKGQDLLESTVALLTARNTEAEYSESAASPTIRYEAPEQGMETSVLQRKGYGSKSRQKKDARNARQEYPDFENFVVNAKHRDTLHVLKDVLPRNPRSVSPVVLYGAPGTGKTHLAHAVEQRLMEFVGTGILFLSADTIVDEAVVQQNDKHVHGIIIEDTHHLPVSEAARSAFMRLLEASLSAGNPVLITGTGRPTEWPIGETLLSRLRSGVSLLLPQADMDMCLRFAQQRCKNSGLPLEREALLYIVRRFPDIRRLEGILKRLEALKALLRPEGGLTLADVEHMAEAAEGPGLTPQAVMQLVADEYGVTIRDIMGSQRKPKVVRARQMAMFLCRDVLGHSYPAIGQIFGGKDHSTVIYAVQKIKSLQSGDEDTNILVTEMTKRCRKLAD